MRVAHDCENFKGEIVETFAYVDGILFDFAGCGREQPEMHVSFIYFTRRKM